MTTREFEDLRAKADAGNADAQVKIGLAYEKGDALITSMQQISDEAK